MAARLIDGKALSNNLRSQVAAEIKSLAAAGKPVHLVAVLVGESGAAVVYAENQAKTCEQLGIRYSLKQLPAHISQDDLKAEIQAFNADAGVTGIMVHLPLPTHLDPQEIQYAIDPIKDVEGVNPANIGHLLYGHPIIAPCTALAAVELIESTGAKIEGSEAVVVGASRIAGRPIALLLTTRNATVTLCHIYTSDLYFHTRRADILVVAVGKPGLITAAHVKPRAVVIDVGINRVTGPDGKTKTVGDVAFDSVAAIAGHITPVPGGVGPMTVAMLLKNTLRAARLVYGLEKP